MKFRLIRDQWFLVGVGGVFAFALADPGGITGPLGRWLSAARANEACLAIIFVMSGLDMGLGHLREALRDWRGVALSMGFTFVVAPLLAWGLSFAASSREVALGMMILGVVSTTQASGIVMAGAAGGSSAHALLISVLSNALCVFTIPSQLSWMLAGAAPDIRLPWGAMMVKLAALILLPLAAGMAARAGWRRARGRGAQTPSGGPRIMGMKPSVVSRLMILAIILVGLCGGRASILGGGARVAEAFALTLALHLALAGLLWGTLRALGWGAGRRESVFYMGVQKTLPQAIWLQATYFAPHGLALVVCLLYHVTQLVVDSWWVGLMAAKKRVSA
jgi:predicted Na+-dependent transporter